MNRSMIHFLDGHFNLSPYARGWKLFH